MPPKKGKSANAKRLAKNISKSPKAPRNDGKGKGAARAGARGHSARAFGNAGSISPLSRLVQLLGEEKIRFQVVGMTAAAMQGVIMGTIDTDIWVDLPERQYIRLLNIVTTLGGTALSPTVYVLPDGKMVNFLFKVNGVGSFGAEYKKAVRAKLDGYPVKALPLKRILASKKAIRRDKDANHILEIEKFLKRKKEYEAL